jgi:hypothetical protein
MGQQRKSRATENDHGPSVVVASEIPQSFFCPLTLEVMLDPVVLDSAALLGKNRFFERVAIEGWLHYQHNALPVTMYPTSVDALIPNEALKQVIHNFMGEEWVNARRKVSPSGSHESYLAGAGGAPVTAHHDHQCQYQRIINTYLGEISDSIDDMDLQLGENGTCGFQYASLEFRIEVKHHSPYVSITGHQMNAVISDKVRDRILRVSESQAPGGGGLMLAQVAAAEEREEKMLGEPATPLLVQTECITESLTPLSFRHVLNSFVNTAMALLLELRPLPAYKGSQSIG